jgi:putative peptidoglycan lipid II flippase
VVRLSGWTFGYVVANAVRFAVVIALASHAEPGTATSFTYAYQFFQLPYGLLAVAVITAFLPELSRLAAASDVAGFGDRFLQAVRLTALLILPTTVGYLLLAQPMVALLFEHRSFTAADAHQLADTLVAFSVGLPAFCLYLLSMRGFYAHKDTRHPFFINLGENTVNVVLATVLVGRFGPLGLALAFALAYVLGSVISVVLLQRRAGRLPWGPSAGSLLRMVGATLVMAIAVAVVDRILRDQGNFVRTVGGVVTGVAVYIAAAAALRLPELRQALGLVRHST